jgi:hypothetical protein
MGIGAETNCGKIPGHYLSPDESRQTIFIISAMARIAIIRRAQDFLPNELELSRHARRGV